MKNNRIRFPFFLIILGLGLLAVSLWQYSKSLTNLEWPNFIARSFTKPTETIEGFNPIFKVLTNHGGSDPIFHPDGKSLLYINSASELVHLDLLDTSNESVLMVLPNLDILGINLKGDQLIVQRQVSTESLPAIDLINIPKKIINVIAENAWGASLSPNQHQITYLTMLDNNEELWQINSSGNRPDKISSLEEIYLSEYVDWSNLENRLLVQTAVGLSVSSFVQDQTVPVNWLPWAKDASWSPDGWMIAYRISERDTDTLWVSNLDGEDARQVYQGIFSEVNWLPDNRLVFFTPGKEGGAACWALDPKSGAKELLADSSIVCWKPVDHIAVSPTGDALAFEAQDGQIWLLRLNQEK